MILQHNIGTSIALVDPSHERPLWRYVYAGRPKPFIHPLCTPRGINLAMFEPHDHVWHRGLWFTIKFINGENFWEEHPPFGTQRTLAPPTVTHGGQGQISLFSALQWVRPDGQSLVFNEQRLIRYVPLDDAAYALDLTFILHPLVDVLLDRTPFTTWGGYGGLCFRGDRNWQQTRLLFPDGTTSDRPAPYRAEWCDLSGKLDGGPDLAGGIAIFDHPANVRHPAPWYGATGAGHYFNAAFLFSEPMTLTAGQSLSLNYRAYIHDGMADVPQLQRAYDTWLAQTPATQMV